MTPATGFLVQGSRKYWHSHRFYTFKSVNPFSLSSLQLTDDCLFLVAQRRPVRRQRPWCVLSVLIIANGLPALLAKKLVIVTGIQAGAELCQAQAPLC